MAKPTCNNRIDHLGLLHQYEMVDSSFSYDQVHSAIQLPVSTVGEPSWLSTEYLLCDPYTQYRPDLFEPDLTLSSVQGLPELKYPDQNTMQYDSATQINTVKAPTLSNTSSSQDPIWVPSLESGPPTQAKSLPKSKKINDVEGEGIGSHWRENMQQ